MVRKIRKLTLLKGLGRDGTNRRDSTGIPLRHTLKMTSYMRHGTVFTPGTSMIQGKNIAFRDPF